MRLYTFLRQWMSESNAALIVGAWYAVMMFLIFISITKTGGEVLRYANL